ncbi:DUF4226 domain-containing protein [Mycobacteroides abscessus]|uniref:DUF4226 domain-containing protein n=1 Tax=Mycobacteroides abscessus TaxID=36809 RepID=UPI0009A88CF0|nr:DUF4226 domain-containing protein [Mycobacteroides abscessus]SLF48493.1 Biofilm regulator BssS [Mycobacteroides abscessus subsp. abscessus]
MATKDELVSAITHIQNYLHSDKWRGNLNDFEYQQIKSIYEDGTPGSAAVQDTLIGSLRNQWPALFDSKTGAEIDPPAGQPVTPPAAGAQQPKPDGSTAPAAAPTEEMSGSAVDAARRLDSALTKNHSALNDANTQLSDAILKAQTSDETTRARLKALQQSIIDEVKKVGPTLDTQAGQEQLATFLQGKTSEITDVIKTGKLDSQSQAAVLDALAERYKALGQKPAEGGVQSGGGTGETGGSGSGAEGGTASIGAGGETGLGTDTGLGGGLASDPLMAGLLGQGAGALGPALGAAAGIPAQMAGMIPGLGGGGGGLSDLGGTIGNALRDARGAEDSDPGAKDKKPEDLKDPETKQKPETPPDQKPPELKDQKPTGPAGTNGETPPAAGPGQVPGAVTAAADVTVKLPDGSQVKVPNSALAAAGEDVLAGGNVHDAYNKHNINLAPPGTPVDSRSVVSNPGRLEFGDIGQFTDHQVMAVGGGKVYSGGQIIAVEQLETGDNFLGWMRPTLPAAAAPSAGTATAVAASPAPGSGIGASGSVQVGVPGISVG